MKLETLLINKQKGNENASVVSPIHVSSTFEISDSNHFELSGTDKNEYTYGRFGTPVLTKLEQALCTLEDNCSSLTYSSGIAAAAAIFDCIFPKRILISSGGFLGTQRVVSSYMKGRDVKKYSIENDLQAAIDEFEEGDLIWLESPRNPHGQISDIKAYVKNFSSNVVIVVDSTLAPPPIQYALKLGADMSLISCTKHLGGHSDLLGGVVLFKDPDLQKKMYSARINQGNLMGNLEAWLLLRSLKTYVLRIMRQSESAAKIAQWLDSKSEKCLEIVDHVYHASLKHHPDHTLSKKQDLKTQKLAKDLPALLKLFTHATSFGGVDSLIEWRFRSDYGVSPRLCRLSIGLEDPDDLIEDLRRAMKILNSQK